MALEREHIYALYSEYDMVKSYFYVGRSKRSPEIRLNEHLQAVNNTKKTEDVYCHIRDNLMLCGIPVFEHEILCWCDDNEPQDCEDYYVIKLIRKGHKLMNMKKGDAKKTAAQNEIMSIAKSKEVFHSVNDLKAYRVKRAAEAYQKSEALRAEVLLHDFHHSSPVPQWLKDTFKRDEAEVLAARKIHAAKAEKRAISKAAREADYQRWLAEQRLFYDANRPVDEQ